VTGRAADADVERSRSRLGDAARLVAADQSAVGNTVYGDRTFTSPGCRRAGRCGVDPAGERVQVGAGNPLVTFTIQPGATVYVAATPGRASGPGWTAVGWTPRRRSPDSEGGTTRKFEVYGKTFPAGQVALARRTRPPTCYVVAVS